MLDDSEREAAQKSLDYLALLSHVERLTNIISGQTEVITQLAVLLEKELLKNHEKGEQQ